MTETLVYLYAVGDASLHDAVEPGTMTGVDGAPLRMIRAGGLAAAVSLVDRVRFSAASLRRTPEDLRQLEDIAKAHHDVVDMLAHAVALAPMPLGTLHLNDDSVQAVLTEKAAEFSTVLARIRGRTEWSVKAFAVAPSQAPEVTVASGAGPDTSYLLRNRSAAERLRLLVKEEWHAPSPRLELTGPRAAYSFATVDEPWP